MPDIRDGGPIPEELLREARAVVDDININDASAVPAIARAIMAARKDERSIERERAARIARRKIVGGYMHGSPEWPDGIADFPERMEAAGLIELVPVTATALEDPFAYERGIEPGGMMWQLTPAGRAALSNSTGDA